MSRNILELLAHMRPSSRPSRRPTCAAAAAETTGAEGEGEGMPGAAASVREISTADWREGRRHGHRRRTAARLRSVALEETTTTTTFLFRVCT